MSDVPADTDATPHATGEEHGEHHPRGTFVLMLLFITMIAAMWLWMYIVLVTS